MHCPFTGIGMSVAPSSCQKMGCGLDGEFCWLERCAVKAETSHAGLMTAYERTGPMSFDEYPADDKQLTERSNALRYRASEMDRQNPMRVETGQPDLLPDYSQAPPELEMLAGFEPADSMTDKDGSRKSMLYGSGMPWPMPDSARDPAGYAAWLSENTERARMIEQRFQAAAKPALTGGRRNIQITAGPVDASNYRPPLLSFDQAREQQYDRFARGLDDTRPSPPAPYDHKKASTSIYWLVAGLGIGAASIAAWLELLRL